MKILTSSGQVLLKTYAGTELGEKSFFLMVNFYLPTYLWVWCSMLNIGKGGSSNITVVGCQSALIPPCQTRHTNYFHAHWAISTCVNHFEAKCSSCSRGNGSNSNHSSLLQKRGKCCNFMIFKATHEILIKFKKADLHMCTREATRRFSLVNGKNALR